MDKEKNEDNKTNTIFDASAEEKIRSAFENLTGEVSIQAVLQPTDCKLSVKTIMFLDELSNITDKIPINDCLKGENPELEAKIEVSLYPVIALLNKDGEYTRICYHGPPSGHELESFISAVNIIANPEQAVAEPLLERINNLKVPINLKTGVSPTCVMCPELVQSCQSLATLNSGVTSEMVDLHHYPDFVKKFRIMSVPALIINDEKVKFGGKNLGELVTELEEYSK